MNKKQQSYTVHARVVEHGEPKTKTITIPAEEFEDGEAVEVVVKRVEKE